MRYIAELEAAAAFGGFSPRIVANPVALSPSFKRTVREIASDLWARARIIAIETYHALRGRMIVYSTSLGGHHVPVQRMYVRPASAEPGEGPADWYEDEEKTLPRQFQVTFQFGRANVPDTLGKWLLDQGMAKRTTLSLPVKPQLIRAS